MQAIRAICWLLGIMSVILVIAGYDSLPAEFPVSRWSTSPKTPLLALRVPLINLASLAIVELLTSNVRRDRQSITRAERYFYVCLLGTVAAKIAIETFEIVYLQHFQSPVFKYGLVGFMLLGLSGAGHFFLRLEPARRKSIFKTDATKVVATGLLVVAILALNVPLLGGLWSLKS
ncbi:MAG: hypothetical protein AB7O59_19635 [Pirellulales bacterium]